MRLLFDLGHPAHVHLFRNLIKKVLKDGGEVLAATREKDITIDLRGNIIKTEHMPNLFHRSFSQL